MSSPFKYETKRISTFIITGSFCSGSRLTEFGKLINAIKENTNDSIHLDLNNVFYMDSDSFKLIWNLLRDSKHSAKFNPNSWTHKRYLDYAQIQYDKQLNE